MIENKFKITDREDEVHVRKPKTKGIGFKTTARKRWCFERAANISHSLSFRQTGPNTLHIFLETISLPLLLNFLSSVTNSEFHRKTDVTFRKKLLISIITEKCHIKCA